jgi:hypothetical protein
MARTRSLASGRFFSRFSFHHTFHWCRVENPGTKPSYTHACPWNLPLGIDLLIWPSMTSSQQTDCRKRRQQCKKQWIVPQTGSTAMISFKSDSVYRLDLIIIAITIVHLSLTTVHQESFSILVLPMSKAQITYWYTQLAISYQFKLRVSWFQVQCLFKIYLNKVACIIQLDKKES